MAQLKNPSNPHKQIWDPESFGLKSAQHADNFIPLQFRYAFKNPFTEVASGFIKKWYWENGQTFTTVNNVRQLDEDRIVFYRRCEHHLSEGNCAWEQVVINR